MRERCDIIGIIFARESNRYDKTVYSLKSQVEACLARAKADGVAVSERHIFREQFSGKDLGKMPKLGELRKLLASTPGRKKVYCYAQDRLFRGRKGYHIFRVLAEFDEWETDVCFVLDNVDTSSVAGQIQVLFKGEKAAREPDDILDRTMRGKLKRIKEGKIPGFGRNKYGYTKDNATGKAAVNEAEACVLRRIVRDLLAGESISEVCRRLSAEGVPPPFPAKGEKASKLVRHGKWWASSVVRILRDPAYKGEGAALRRVSVDGRVKPRSKDGWIKLPEGCYPPIVSPAEWDRLQDLFDKNKGAKTRNKSRPALLRGLIFCAVCGRPFYLANNKARGRTNLYYRCSTIATRRTRPELARCEVKQISAKWIEEAVWSDVYGKISDPEKLKAVLEQGAESGDSRAYEGELEALRSELAKRDAQERNLAREMRDATVAVARIIKTELESIESERAALAERQAELLRRRSSRDLRLKKAAELETSLRAMAKRLRRATFEGKREVLEELGARVTVNGREFNVDYSIGG